jgi:hypothetical protein
MGELMPLEEVNSCCCCIRAELEIAELAPPLPPA